MERKCETPKSPPGDYNPQCSSERIRAGNHVSVKHLNPRQGITTHGVYIAANRILPGVKHLNPRQGITTDKMALIPDPVYTVTCVKHLNPRQGITTVWK